MNIQSCQSSFQLPRQLLPAEWLHQRWWLGWLRCSLWLSVRRSACPQGQQISGWTRIAKPGLSAFGRSLRSSCRQGIPLMKLLSLLNLWTTWMKGSFCVASFACWYLFSFSPCRCLTMPKSSSTACQSQRLRSAKPFWAIYSAHRPAGRNTFIRSSKMLHLEKMIVKAAA